MRKSHEVSQASTSLAAALITLDTASSPSSAAHADSQHPITAPVRSFSPDCNWTWVDGLKYGGAKNTDTVFGDREGHTMVMAIDDGGNGELAYVFGGIRRLPEFTCTPMHLRISIH